MSFRDKVKEAGQSHDGADNVAPNPTGPPISNPTAANVPRENNTTNPAYISIDSPLYGDWITVTKVRKGQNQLPKKGQSKSEATVDKISNRFQRLRTEEIKESANEKERNKGKPIIIKDSENLPTNPKIWVRKRPRKDVVGPSSSSGTPTVSTKVPLPIPDLPKCSPTLLNKMHVDPSSVTKWADGTRTSRPIIRISPNRFSFMDQEPESVDATHKVNVGNGAQWPKKPPDPIMKENNDNSMETFQDCDEEVGSQDGAPAWNVRGSRSSRGKRYIKQLISSYRPSLCFLFETHCQFSLEESFWTKLGFELAGLMEAQNHSGGVWVLKDQQVDFSLEVVDMFPQMVTFRCYKGLNSWIGNAVYASPVPSGREMLWNHIRSVHMNINSPWVLLGDFNENLFGGSTPFGHHHFTTSLVPQISAAGLNALTAVVSKDECLRDYNNSVRDFLWSNSANDNSVHLVGWDHVILPKKLGGLAVREARCTNTALLGKLMWKILIDKECFWVKVLSHKYLNSKSILFAKASPSASIVWRSIIKAKDSLHQGVKMNFGRGDTAVWDEDWTGLGPLCNQVPFVHISDTLKCVKDLWPNGCWDFSVAIVLILPVRDIGGCKNSRGQYLELVLGDGCGWLMLQRKLNG
ncbi:Endonuclease/exonuclease/phosphatase superfamily [Sesbania bispinosa]|nr:Endonuclease/exonuclease/phosphatase superfamily [Sesbania bispinosa]